MKKKLTQTQLLLIITTCCIFCFIQPLGRHFVTNTYSPLLSWLIHLALAGIWSTFFLIPKKTEYQVAGLLALLSFVIHFLANKFSIGELGLRSSLLLLPLSFFIGCFSVLVNRALSFEPTGRLAIVLTTTSNALLNSVPFCFCVYALQNQQPVNEYSIIAVFQSNTNEVYEFFLSQVSEWAGFSFLLFVTVQFLLCKKLHNAATHSPISLRLTFLIFISLVSMAFTSKDNNVYAAVHHRWEAYHNELKLFRETQQQRNTASLSFKASKTNTGETYLVVLGESLNKRHMGVYGYHRNTTPKLSALANNDELLVFDNAYANHTHTIHVLSQALTNANQINKQDFFHCPSILNVLKQANFETYWISNQVLYGPWDNLTSVLAHEADSIIGINQTVGKSLFTQHFDEQLIPYVQTVLKQATQKNRVIFVHLMGNHAQYKQRYPATFEVFNDTADMAYFGRAKQNSPTAQINDYDNSVLYNDFVVDSLLNSLKSCSTGPSAFIYLADHADDVLANKFHGASQFTFEMTQIPLLIWLSDEYKIRYPNPSQTLIAHQKTLFCNDFLYNTLIGLTNINTTATNNAFDLCASNYQFDDTCALTLHGEQAYNAPDNYLYWQKTNLDYLKANQLENKVFPHRVNSIGKLADIWQAGYRSFEVDVIFDSEKNQFLVGHDRELNWANFTTLLNSVPTNNIGRIWVDLKNLNASNYQQVIEKLESINRQHPIKSKCIIESDTEGNYFQQLNKRGWHTSYYLPTTKISRLLETNNTEQCKIAAQQLLRQLKKQHVSAISFDTKLTPFVIRYLEPYLAKNIPFHVWYGPSLYSHDFAHQLVNSPILNNPRVKTILCRYDSPFHL